MRMMKAKSILGTDVPVVTLEEETDVVKLSEKHDTPLIEHHVYVSTFIGGVQYMAKMKKEEEKDE